MRLFEIHLFGATIGPTFYGLMYVFGFIFGYLIVKKNLKDSKDYIDALFIYIVLGVILGARLGYILFYDLGYYLDNPLDILKTWKGGMSFHGGVIGVILAMLIFSKIKKINFYKLADAICYSLPFGLFFGRIGNYINGELYGYAGYTGPFAIEKGGESYFPSPLLEAFLEGILLFIILTLFKKYAKLKDGQLASLFLIFYAIFRIFVEIFFRLPDENIGYIMGIFTMGEILSLPMLIFGIFYFIKLQKNEK